ncbi:MAG: hypothetical protein KDB03_13590 [Planctomycetales bacterium]|nr:hypothetical protein [Planctomycetales bacterium]
MVREKTIKSVKDPEVKWQCMATNWKIGFALVVGAALAASSFGYIVWQRANAPTRPNNVGEITKRENTKPTTSQILSDQEVQQGFLIMDNPDPMVHTIVHPNSPCWLEIPRDTASILPLGHTQNSVDLGYVGPESCAECHKREYDSFVKTPHYNTSSAASAKTVLGPFEPGHNQMLSQHPDLSFTMLQKPDGTLEQIVNFRELKRNFNFDISIGSGKIAQTYLYWHHDALYQLHVTYFRALNSWINSPGYGDGTAWFSRRVIPKCFQCHMTYIDWYPGTEHMYSQDKIIYGVTCERCHGPGEEHVNYHRENMDERVGKFISNPADLEPARANDVCGQCHSGSADFVGPSFGFRPGDELTQHWRPAAAGPGVENKVHTANQLQRLELSACYKNTDNMRCNQCHDPHRAEHGNLQLFSERCIKCHQPETCGEFEMLGAAISENCIDCHLGLESDEKINIQTANSMISPPLRDHFIRIIPEKNASTWTK